MDLIATKRCFYRVWREPGERFTADRARGRALVQMKKARRAPVTAPATYSHRAITQTRRVDMQAAPTPAPALDLVEVVAPAAEDELKTVRAEYTEKLGKRPFPGWPVGTLREKIAAADEPEDIGEA